MGVKHRGEGPRLAEGVGGGGGGGNQEKWSPFLTERPQLSSLGQIRILKLTTQPPPGTGNSILQVLHEGRRATPEVTQGCGLVPAL